MSVTLREKAYAKINLSLDILGKREDGFHDLRSVMASVSLFDDLEITLTPCDKGTETYTAFAEGVEGDNIAAGAARSFMESAGVTGWSAAIHIEKRIPVCAGLGGGSSNAAAVLRALAGWIDGSVYPLKRTLPELAAELGSDVPYCLRGGVCLAEGRGERLTPLAPLPEHWHIILCSPPLKVSTAEAFAKYDALDPLSQGLAKMSENVFEAVTFFPEINEIKSVMLDAGASNAAMSGSGPAVFAVFDDETQANTAFEKLYPTFPATFALRPV
jgi:4-diphosphocytidyl-2-C-methyl-D-erythritol kinase